ncbi:hypothetical protein [Pseudoalteromonas piscicida]|uniref:Uncharacterized protein n=1 Tax=Pseudoalteromonas piscicida TaxID=43662 RepID=A0A2A5JL93_PSEO7|nr:hypothetical protein [Pseudoalteromonas piscicida]PCK30200.1 hypothetical protein CEX98_18780 [Pseudoalteromonas piscicida]
MNKTLVSLAVGSVAALLLIYTFSNQESSASEEKVRYPSQVKEDLQANIEIHKPVTSTPSSANHRGEVQENDVAEHDTTYWDQTPQLGKRSDDSTTTSTASNILDMPLKRLNTAVPLTNVEPTFSEHAIRYQGDLSTLRGLQVGEQFKTELLGKQIKATLKTANQTKDGNQYLAFTLNNGSNFKQLTLSYSKTGIRGKVVIDGMKYHLRAVDGTVLLMSYKDYIKLHDLEDHTEKER